jgi:hypothetical protein
MEYPGKEERGRLKASDYVLAAVGMRVTAGYSGAADDLRVVNEHCADLLACRLRGRSGLAAMVQAHDVAQSTQPSRRSRLGSHWDCCGVHYVEPIEGGRHRE